MSTDNENEKNTQQYTAQELRMQEISARMKSRRLELGMSLQELAEQTGITKSTLSRYETGSIRSMPFGKISDVASALNVSEQWLLGTSKEERSFHAFTGLIRKFMRKQPTKHKNVQDYVLEETLWQFIDSDKEIIAQLTADYYSLNKQRRETLLNMAKFLVAEQQMEEEDS